MRLGWGALAGLLGVACAPPVPIGVYRLPVQTGDAKVELRTMLVRTEDPDLVLFDAGAGREFGRGQAQYAWDGTPEPFVLRQKPYVMSIYVRDGVIEDAVARPWATAPAQPVLEGVDSLVRVTLVSGSARLVLGVAGVAVFGDGARAQPAPDAVAGPLEILDSVAGVGLTLPADAPQSASWRDALSAAVPPDATRPVACASPLVSVYRTFPGEAVEVPAGKYVALRVVEIIDSCLQRSPADLQLFEVDRWYAPGVGPVKMRYQARDGKWREYALVHAEVAAGADGLWPFAAGNAWTYEVRGPDGAVVDPAARVAVEKLENVRIP